MAKKSGGRWFVYLLECKNGRLYTGIATDVGARFRKHSSGKGAMFTRLNRPSHVVGARKCRDRSEASRLEAVIKRLSPGQKRMTAGEWPPFIDGDS